MDDVNADGIRFGGSGGDPARTTRAGSVDRCPRCHSGNVAEIHYGYPTPEVWDDPDLAAGEFVLGGCCVMLDAPDHHCNACGNDWIAPIYGDPGLLREHICVSCGGLLGDDPEDELDGEGPGRDICGDCNRTRNWDTIEEFEIGHDDM
jgi:hypothetical protein